MRDEVVDPADLDNAPVIADESPAAGAGESAAPAADTGDPAGAGESAAPAAGAGESAAPAADDPAAPAGADEPTAPGGDEAVPAGTDGLPGDDLTEAQLEALLFVAERPLGRRELATITGASSETIDARLGDLEVTLAERGVRLLVDRDRVALVTAPEAGLVIGRYVGREPTRLSPATIETLAIVAYRQPVTKAGIERIRGVDAEYAIRSLLHRRLVVELGRADTPGRPFLYGTSVDFLERFGLLSLDELPVLDAAVAERVMGQDAGGGDDGQGFDVAPGDGDPAFDAAGSFGSAVGGGPDDAGLR